MDISWPPAMPRSRTVLNIASDDEEPLPPSELSVLSSRLIAAEKRHTLAGRALQRVEREMDSLAIRRQGAGLECASARIALLQVRRRMHTFVSGDDISADVDVLDEEFDAPGATSSLSTSPSPARSQSGTERLPIPPPALLK